MILDKIYFEKIHEEAFVPKTIRPGDAGFDLASDQIVGLESGERALVRTGVRVAIPEGYVGLLCVRSGIAANKGIQVLNSPGVIDSNYRGEVKVLLHNTDKRTQWINEGDRIAQLVIVPCLTESVVVDTLPENSYRGEAGFGSSGT